MTLRSIAGKARRAVPGVAAVILVTLATGCSAGCSASVSIGHEKEGGTYSDHGISLKVPDGWMRKSGASHKSKTGDEKWSESFAPASGDNLVSLTVYSTNVAITKENAEGHAPQVAAVMKNLFASTGGKMVSGPTETSLKGMAGYRFETTYRGESGTTLDSQLLLVWDENTEYYFNCQFEKNGSRRAEIERGCNAIESTFKLD